MHFIRVFVFGFITLILVNSASAVTKLEVCPPQDEISPCTCFNESFGLHVRCTYVNQLTIERTLQKLKTYGAPELPIFLGRFDIDAGIDILDLSPFTETHIGSLHISGISGNIIGPTFHTIRVEALYLNPSYMFNFLGNTLMYFVPSILTLLHYECKTYTGNPVLGQFVPGLNHLTHLRHLFFWRGNITSIFGGQFYFNTALGSLYLPALGIQEIGNNAFLFDEFPPGTNTLLIDLGGNKITSNKFSVHHKLETVNAIVYLNLNGNRMDTIDILTFKPFLQKYGNTLYMSDNPIFCDGRVKWLKDEKNFYQPKVRDADCDNDPGKTVFTSSLVP
jgi:hypothetical protein